MSATIPPEPLPFCDAGDLHRLRDVRIELLRDQAHEPSGALITCAGRSMEPTVMLGDRVRVYAAPRIRAGDVVLFASARGVLVLHRVVMLVPGGWFVHAGDAGYDDSPQVAPLRSIIGRADLARRPIPLRTRAAGLARVARAALRRATKRPSGGVGAGTSI